MSKGCHTIALAVTTLCLAALAYGFLLHGLSQQDFGLHPDEPLKIAQIANGTRNLNHPPLMLEAIRGVSKLLGSQGSLEFARLGRALSNVLAARARARLTQALAIVLAAGLVIGQGIASADVIGAIRSRTVEQLRVWITENVDAGATILTERAAGLQFRDLHSGSAFTDTRRVEIVTNVGKGCREVSCWQFDYVVLACENFTRFLQSDVTLSADALAIRAFYLRLFLENRPVYVIGDPASDSLVKYGVFEGTCILVYRRLSMAA